MSSQLLLTPRPRESRDGKTIRSCEVIRQTKGRTTQSDLLWLEMPEDHGLFADTDCDPYLTAMLMDAMSEGREIIVRGEVSKGLLSNLTEYQSIWSTWLPNEIHSVEIHADRLRSIGPSGAGPDRKAVCAFSGGVDAAFTVWRHHQGQLGHRSQSIAFCVFLQGFDIPVADDIQGAQVLENCRMMLGDLGLDIIPMRTNFREISQADWRYAHGGALVSALSCFRPAVNVGLLGSGLPYNRLATPWGSSPLLDPLLGGEDFAVLHDGASHSRTEKAALLSEWPAGRDRLRVCWQGGQGGGNCGECEKCIRTALNFVSAGHPIPDCLPGRESLEAGFHNIQPVKAAARLEWEIVLEAAIRNRVDQATLNFIRRVLRKKPRRKPLKTIKHFVKRVRRPAHP